MSLFNYHILRLRWSISTIFDFEEDRGFMYFNSMELANRNLQALAYMKRMA